jgi:hypothetical protein
MRRLLGSVLPALLLVTALGACGDESSSDAAASDPTVVVSSPGGTGGPDDTDDSADSVDFDLVDTITVTAAGGALSEVAVPLTDDTSVQEFVSQFESDDMAAQVQVAVTDADVPDGQVLYAAVVAIGCDSPTDVSVVDTGSGLAITANKVPSPQQECFAPMTTVALVLAPAS